MVEALEQSLHVQVLRFRRLLVGLVVDGDVVHDVLTVAVRARLAVHAAQTVAHDVGDLERPRRVVGHHGGVRRGQQLRVPVGVLEPLAGQRGTPRRRAQHEPARHLVGRRVQAVTGALEPEHRVEDVDRDHRLAVRGVRRAHGGERRGGARLVDALVQQLALLGLLVGEHELGVDGRVVLPLRVVDLRRREHRVEPEGPRLVRDDRHQAVADLRVLGQLTHQPDERHRGGDFLLARTLADGLVHLVAGQHQRLGGGPAFRQVAAEGLPAALHVLDLRRVVAGVVIRRQRRVALELLVADRDALGVPEQLEVVERELLHLVGGVAALEGRTEAVALDGVGEDHGRLAVVLHRGLVRRVHLAVVVPTALEVPDLLVGEVLHQVLRARVASEEMLPHVGAVVGLVRLVVAVRRLVHQVDERAVAVGVQQRVPLAAPDHLDDVPARAAEVGLELLDDLAVAADRAVEALQVAVDDEGEVVEPLAGGHVDEAAGLRLVHLAVAQERPDVLVARVLDAACVQVTVEPRLVDRVHRAEAHRHGGVLPEVRHQPRVRVGRQAAALTGVGVLLTEPVELLGGEPALQESPGVDAGGGVALDEDLVATSRVVLASEEVVEAHLVERRGRRVGGDVTADADTRPLRTVHHDRGVPADERAVAAFDFLVAGEPRLVLRGDGVDVVRGRQRRHAHVALTGTLQHPEHQVPRALLTAPRHSGVEGVEPFGRLLRVDVGQVRRQSVADDADTRRCSLAGGACGAAPGLVVLGGQGISSPKFGLFVLC